MDYRNEFTIDLVSNGSMNIYPDNSLSKFQNQIDPPLELSGDWEVALTEIFFPLRFSDPGIRGTFQIVLRKFNVFFKNYASKELDRIYEPGLQTLNRVFDVKFGVNDTMKDKVKALNNSLEETIDYIKSELKFPIRRGSGSSFRIGDEQQVIFKSGEVKFYIPDQSVVKEGYGVDAKFIEVDGSESWPTKGVLIYLKFHNIEVLRSLGFKYNPIEFLDEYEKHYDPEVIGSKSEVPETNESNIFLMFVYTDIIRDHFVGGTQTPVLRAVPLTKGVYDRIGYCTFEHLIYYPVRKNHIEGITVFLAHDTGDQVLFKEGGRVFLSLRFQKRKLYKD